MHQPGWEEPAVDDIAFISQFAVFPNPSAPIRVNQPQSAASHASATKARARSADIDSEDEVEAALIGLPPKYGDAISTPIVRESDPLNPEPAAALRNTQTKEPTSDSSSDSSSDEEEEISALKLIKARHAAFKAELDSLAAPDTTILADVDDGFDEDDSENGGKGSKVPAAAAFSTKHELVEPPIVKVDLESIEADEEMIFVGEILSIVGSAVIVQAIEHGSHRILDTGSVFAFQDRKVLGAVFEAFGPVMKPMYSVRFSSALDVDTELVVTGKKVFYVPGRSTFLFTNALRLQKGSDASNVYDEEVDARELEFSDDEDERAHKKELEAARKNRAGSMTPSSSAAGPSSFLNTSNVSSRLTNSEHATDIFYGNAHYETQDKSLPSASPMPSIVTPALEASSRPLPSAYEDLSPYSENLPTVVSSTPTETPALSPVLADSGHVPPQSRSRSDFGGAIRTERGRGRGRGRDEGRGGSRGSLKAGSIRGRRHSRGHGAPQSFSDNTPRSSIGAQQEEYDPRNPGLLLNNTGDSGGLPYQGGEPSSFEGRLSPTSLAIARATGQWEGHQPQQESPVSPFSSLSSPTASFAAYQADPSSFLSPFQGSYLQQTAQHQPYGGSTYDGTNNGFVAPHINPRFAAGMAGINSMGGGGINFQMLAQQQQQMYWQQQQYYLQQQEMQQHGKGDTSADPGPGDIGDESVG